MQNVAAECISSSEIHRKRTFGAARIVVRTRELIKSHGRVLGKGQSNNQKVKIYLGRLVEKKIVMVCSSFEAAGSDLSMGVLITPNARLLGQRKIREGDPIN